MEVRTDVPAPDGGGDQVEVVRAWLRERGVDPGPDTAHPDDTSLGTAGERARARTPATGGSGAGSFDRWSSGPRSADRPAGRKRRRGRWAETHETAGGPDGAAGSSRRRDVRVDGEAGTDPDAEVGTGRRTRSEPDVDPEELARGIVLRKLAAQARTRAELERALHQKEVPVEAATAVLDWMGEVGLVDDTAFARDWVASRQQRRHLSRTALRRELQTKGVDRDVIDDALDAVDSADEHRAALDLARRRSVPMAGLERGVAYRRLGAMLARRGFSAAVTTRVLAEVLDAHEEL